MHVKLTDFGTAKILEKDETQGADGPVGEDRNNAAGRLWIITEFIFPLSLSLERSGPCKLICWHSGVCFTGVVDGQECLQSVCSFFVFFFARSESEICYFEALISGRWDASSTSCSLGALLSKEPTSTRLFKKSRKWTTNSLMGSLPWRETLWKSCWFGSYSSCCCFLPLRSVSKRS